MHSIERLSAALVIALALTGVAHAAPTSDATDQPRPPETSVDRGTAGESNETPRMVTGRVLKVNADEGSIVIQTPVGIIALRGPSEELRDVSVGDMVQVEMVSGDDESAPSASPRLDTDED